MWFIFPQIAGLGHCSPISHHFAISGRAEEALAYLAHPILGQRLRESTELVNQIPNRPIDATSSATPTT